MTKQQGNKISARFQEILDEYRAKYDIDALSSPNDQANLAAFINLQIMIETAQSKVQELADIDFVGNIDNITKINAALEKMIDKGVVLERALALDRKNRQQEKADSVAEYISGLKIIGREFLEKQFIKVYCPECEIMVGRVIPAIEHTAFECHFQCSQCKKKVTVKRAERDQFFDFAISDREWRKAHAYKVIQARKDAPPNLATETSLVIEDDESEGIDNATTEEA